MFKAYSEIQKPLTNHNKPMVLKSNELASEVLDSRYPVLHLGILRLKRPGEKKQVDSMIDEGCPNNSRISELWLRF